MMETLAEASGLLGISFIQDVLDLNGRNGIAIDRTIMTMSTPVTSATFR